MHHMIYAELPGLPKCDYLHYGESIVWQCTSIQEFEQMILPYTVLNQKTATIQYLCFGQRPSYQLGNTQVPIQYINTEEGFESFILQVYHAITAAQENTLFLFDVLSELQTSWLSDQMIANFFCIICPILARKKTSGVFYIKRNSHSSYLTHTVMAASNLFVDAQCLNEYVRLTMMGNKENHKKQITYLKFLADNQLCLKADPPKMSFAEEMGSKEIPDIWHRYFIAIQQLAHEESLSAEELKKVCHRIMSQEELVEALITAHFTAKDYINIYERMIGSGRIGGKACGFLLGKKLIQKFMPDTLHQLKTQDTYFVGTDVFYTYMVKNNCWSYRLNHRLQGERFTQIKEYEQALLQGSFPSPIRRQFLQMLFHYGHQPLIVRSSSFMEDGYGNAFSGKYESVFCSNQGSIKERLYELEDAIRKVYASTLSSSALEYRRKRKLLDKDEQMALLIQKVSGEQHGDYFFPIAAGVSFSFNPYRWMEHINPKAGMARFVAGMGTRAVNRTPEDYPRLVGLDRPQANLYTTTKDRHRFSQRCIDILNLTTRRIETKSCQEILTLLSPAERRLVFSHDTEAETLLEEQGRYRPVHFTDCQGIIDRRDCIEYLKQILSLLQEHYRCPVDIEFALSLASSGDIQLDLLQCRPLKQKEGQVITVSAYEESDILFYIKQASMSCSKEEYIDTIVYISPKDYRNIPYAQKPQIASIIGNINQSMEHRHALLLVPGRIGTTSPDLGVPVTYADVNQFQAICEVSYHSASSAPELSYGSHMFQDLVEADVFYAAINENRTTIFYQPQLLSSFQDSCFETAEHGNELNGLVHVYDLRDAPAKLYLDSDKGTALCIVKKP